MFQMANDSELTYTWPVNVYVPQNGGKKVKRTFTVDFLVLPQDELDDIIRSGGNMDFETLTRAIVGWKEGQVQDRDGAALPYSDEAKERLLKIPYVRAGLARAYFNSINGASEKN